MTDDALPNSVFCIDQIDTCSSNTEFKMQEDFAALHRITEAPVAGPSTLASKQATPSEPVVTASSKLEPYLVLARSARGPGAAAIIVDQVTAATGVFCFGELLDVQAIAEVCQHVL